MDPPDEASRDRLVRGVAHGDRADTQRRPGIVWKAPSACVFRVRNIGPLPAGVKDAVAAVFVKYSYPTLVEGTADRRQFLADRVK